MTEEKKTIPIGGMHCASCAQTIEGALRKAPGIKEASVNLATEKAYVTYDPNITNENEVIATINSTGYEARLETKKSYCKNRRDDLCVLRANDRKRVEENRRHC